MPSQSAQLNVLRNSMSNHVTGYFNYYIEGNLFVVKLRIGGYPGGDLLFFTAGPRTVILKIPREYFLKFTNVYVRKLMG